MVGYVHYSMHQSYVQQSILILVVRYYWNGKKSMKVAQLNEKKNYERHEAKGSCSQPGLVGSQEEERKRIAKEYT